MTGADAITVNSLPLVLMQVNNVLGTCHLFQQLLILYLQLSQTTITELSLLPSRHLTVVIGSMHYSSFCVIFAWKTMRFVSFSVSAWVPVCANPINARVVTCSIRETIMACHVKGVLENFETQLHKRSYLPCFVTSRNAIDQRTCRVTSH